MKCKNEIYFIITYVVIFLVAHKRTRIETRFRNTKIKYQGFITTDIH